jgi:hypothetical protein
LIFLTYGLLSLVVITNAQVRAACGLLRRTKAALAHHPAISTETFKMIETKAVRPHESALAAIQAALEAGGIEFLSDDRLGPTWVSCAV